MTVQAVFWKFNPGAYAKVRPASIDNMLDLPPNSALSRKIQPRDQAGLVLQQLARPWVFTNGVFDVLHRGHVLYLEQARAMGASLVVALNSDTSARRLGKGADRPLNNEGDRALVVAALESVSLVTWFDEDTPLELVGELRPDFLVKGGDYDMTKLAESRLVQGYGGQALAIAFVDGYSTSKLVARIRQSAQS